MLLPHRTLLAGASLWLLSSLAAVWWTEALMVWQSLGVLLGGVALADAWLAWRRGNPVRLERLTPPIWPLGVEQKIRLRLHWLGEGTSLRGQLFDHHPDAFAADGLPAAFQIAAGQWVELSYRLHPTTRGAHHFDTAHLRLISPLGLWQAQHLAGEPQTVRVYPNFARLAHYALLATGNRLSQIGVLRQRRRGEGSDFEQLREYRRDDPTRRIDWKATARLRKPIVREYQDERDQRIVFLLDCGQRMRSRDGELAHFDHTLDAMLLLAHVALRQGDAVGFTSFAHPEPRFLAPHKSAAALQTLLNTTYDLQPTLRTPDYLAGSETLCRRLRKRSLVVLLTNLRDEDEATLQPALTQLRERHLVLLASLRETGLEQRLRMPVEDFDDALSYAATLDYRQAREKQLARLRAQGVRVLDVAPSQLPVALVNRYWEMKRGGVC